MTIHRTLSSALLGAALVLTVPSFVQADETGVENYIGGAATQFADPDAAAVAFRAALAANDMESVARVLGLDPAKLGDAEGISDRFAEIRDSAARLTKVEGDGDQRVVILGDKVWPFPFPIRKDAGGKWAFDTKAGIEEIVNRRIGENELQAIATARAYVDAQRDYAADDRDGDGVLEYAQKLISSEGKTDGLYWPFEQGDGDSPAGAHIDQAAVGKVKAGDGYFGYHFRVMRAQGNRVAGGRYHYVINGNMIGGFALIAWPVSYAETGVTTFMVNHAGIVYERDLGPDTEADVAGIVRFDPDKTWDIVKD